MKFASLEPSWFGKETLSFAIHSFLLTVNLNFAYFLYYFPICNITPVSTSGMGIFITITIFITIIIVLLAIVRFFTCWALILFLFPKYMFYSL